MFSPNLFKQAIKDHLGSVLTFAVSLFLYAWLLVAIIPTVLKAKGFEELVKSYPKAILALAAGTSQVNIFTVEGFLSIEFLTLWWIIILAGFAIAFTTAIIARETDEGTIEVLLAQPISRSSMVLTRFAALAFYILVLIAVSLASIVLLAAAYDVKLKSANLLPVGFLAFLFVLAISAYTLLLSLVVKGRGKAVVWSVTVLFVFHLVNALSEFNKTVKKFRFLSLFRYYDPYKILRTGHILWRDLTVFALVSVICIALSLLLFRKKDIAVA